VWADVDKAILECMRVIRGQLELQETDRDLLSLPRAIGGLGIPLHEEIAPIAHQAAQEEA